MIGIKPSAVFLVSTILAAFSGFCDAQYKYYFLENYCNGGRGEGHLDLSHQPIDYGIMALTQRDGYPPNMDCWLDITAPSGKGIVIRINWVDIYKPPFDTCTSDVLTIFTVVGEERQPIGGYVCGTGTPRDALYFDRGELALHFVSGNWAFSNRRRGFQLVFTSYRKPVKTIGNQTLEGDCRNVSMTLGEFQCIGRPYGKMCIPEHLRCDQMDNCGDFSDESRDAAKCPYRGLSAAAIAGIVIGVVVLLVVLCFCVGCCIRCSHSKKEMDRVRSSAGLAMMQMPVVVTAGAPEPPPLYTTSTAYHGFNNPACVAPPPYSPSAAAPSVTIPQLATTQPAATQSAATQPATTGSDQAARIQRKTEDAQAKN